MNILFSFVDRTCLTKKNPVPINTIQVNIRAPFNLEAKVPRVIYLHFEKHDLIQVKATKMQKIVTDFGGIRGVIARCFRLSVKIFNQRAFENQ